MKTNVLKKVLKIIGIIILVIIIVLALAIAGFNIYQHISYKEFYSSDNKEFVIPGLSDNFVPQGLTYLPEEEKYLICGYMADGTASRIYMVDPKTNEYNYVELKTETKKADLAHAGGIAVYGDYVFLATGEVINVYDYAEVVPTSKMKNDLVGSAVPVSIFDPQTIPAFVHVEGEKLYVGEFYIAEDYETPEEHHMTTDSGDYNQALMMVFNVEDVIANLETTDLIVPCAAVSIPDNAQGICFLKGGQLCLSQSYGLSSSHIKIYDDPMKSHFNGDTTFTTESGNEVQLYYLDSAHLLKDYKLQPMSEELYADGDRILVMCESACNKYLFGKLTGSKYCYSFLPEY